MRVGLMQVLSVVQMCRYEHSAGSSLLVVVVGKRKKNFLPVCFFADCYTFCLFIFPFFSFPYHSFFSIIFHFSGAFCPTYLPFFCLHIFYYLSFFLLLSYIFFPFFPIIFHFSGAFSPTYLPFFCLYIFYYLSFFLLLSCIFFFFSIIFHFSGAFSPIYLPFFCLSIFYYLSLFLLLSCIFFLSLYFYYDLCVPVSSFRCKKYRLIEWNGYKKSEVDRKLCFASLRFEWSIEVRLHALFSETTGHNLKSRY